jgi:hypothetical protein
MGDTGRRRLKGIPDDGSDEAIPKVGDRSTTGSTVGEAERSR